MGSKVINLVVLILGTIGMVIFLFSDFHVYEVYVWRFSSTVC